MCGLWLWIHILRVKYTTFTATRYPARTPASQTNTREHTAHRTQIKTVKIKHCWSNMNQDCYIMSHKHICSVLFRCHMTCQNCHTQCLLCNPHKGVYIIYSMGRPWLSVVVLEDLLLFVYLKNVSLLLWTRKHQDGGKKYNSPSHRLSSTKEPITERKRWHVGV